MGTLESMECQRMCAMSRDNANPHSSDVLHEKSNFWKIREKNVLFVVHDVMTISCA